MTAVGREVVDGDRCNAEHTVSESIRTDAERGYESNMDTTGGWNIPRRRILRTVGLGLVAGGLISAAGTAVGRVPISGLVAHYKLDSIEGTDTVPDSGPNSIDGENLGATVVNGKVSNAYNFISAENDYVRIPSNSTLSVEEVTVAAWVKPDSSKAYEYIFDGPGHNYLIKENDGTEQPQGGIVVNGTVFIVDGTTTFVEGQWYHVAMTYDRETLRLYVNGVLEGSNSNPSGPIETTVGEARIGSYTGARGVFFGDYPFNGSIDEIYVYNRALSGAELAGLIDISPPNVSDVTVSPNPAPINEPVTLTTTIDDSTTGGSVISKAEYSLDGGATWPLELDPADGTFDESTETVTAALSFSTPQVATVCVTGTDAAGNTSNPVCIEVAVYDPEGGFVSGAGTIYSPPGADRRNPTVEGTARFGFTSKYKRGATQPSGQTRFRFRAGDLSFVSTEYEWLVVAGKRAQFKGSGEINRADDYGFLLTAIDGDLNGRSGSDEFRIKIWEKGTDTVVYDNVLDGSDSATPIEKGRIVIKE